MKKYLLLALLLVCIPMAFAGIEDITFPVSELGGCESKEECKAYCDEPENEEACFDFAVKYELIPEEEIEERKKHQEVLANGGPGGCSSPRECHAYCGNPDNHEECFQFAVDNNLIPPEEAEQMQQHENEIRAAIQNGGPGGCSSMNECRDFCSKEENRETCDAFAEKHGLHPPDHEDRRHDGPREGPGGCSSPEECHNFCSQEENHETCIAFAKEHNLVNEDEARILEQTGGRGPGGCRNHEECAEYCSSNKEECDAFAAERGLEPPKHHPDGPRGPPCNSPEECEQFCENNPEECEKFREHKEGEHMPPQDFKGPGGCEGEECIEYCDNNPEECEAFKEEMGEHRPGDHGEHKPPMPEFNSEEEKAEWMKRNGPPGDHRPGDHGEHMPPMPEFNSEEEKAEWMKRNGPPGDHRPGDHPPNEFDAAGNPKHRDHKPPQHHEGQHHEPNHQPPGEFDAAGNPKHGDHKPPQQNHQPGHNNPGQHGAPDHKPPQNNHQPGGHEGPNNHGDHKPPQGGDHGGAHNEPDHGPPGIIGKFLAVFLN